MDHNRRVGDKRVRPIEVGDKPSQYDQWVRANGRLLLPAVIALAALLIASLALFTISDRSATLTESINLAVQADQRACKRTNDTREEVRNMAIRLQPLLRTFEASVRNRIGTPVEQPTDPTLHLQIRDAAITFNLIEERLKLDPCLPFEPQINRR